jgi:hypothetical protein
MEVADLEAIEAIAVQGFCKDLIGIARSGRGVDSDAVFSFERSVIHLSSPF